MGMKIDDAKALAIALLTKHRHVRRSCTHRRRSSASGAILKLGRKKHNRRAVADDAGSAPTHQTDHCPQR
jgi:hypothetical protein